MAMDKNSLAFNISDILSSIEYENAEEVINKMTKVEYVNKHHKYAISFHSATNGDPLEYYYTRLPDGKKRLKGVNQNVLIDKLYEYYTNKDIDYRFEAIFDAAIEDKIRGENPKEKTIRDYYSSYKRFITDELGNMDIRKITPSYLKEYIQIVTKTMKPTKKAFYKFKGILNLVFNYALDGERRFISVNPIPQKNQVFVKNCQELKSRPEEKAFQPHEIELIKETIWKRIKHHNYDVNGYAILFAIETGVREGEIPSLKWSDISESTIHIHSQQNDEMRDGKKVYYYNPSTKNEKGISQDGRYIPINKRIREILKELRGKQKELGIKTEWVFAKRNGDWITTTAYTKSLYQLCKGNSTRGETGLGLKLSNNHAFRMALNSYVFIPMGLPVTERAKLLGHSADTNLRYYTFAKSDDYLDDICQKWDAFNDEILRNQTEPENVIAFAKRKSPQTANLKTFL